MMVYQQLYCWWAYNEWFATLRRSSVVLALGCWQLSFKYAVKAFSRHLWYLTLEMVPLSLFSCKLNEVEKLELVDCLLALKPKEPIPFPQCQSTVVPGMVSQASQKNIDSFHTLAHLVIFTLLNNNHSFLGKDALNWPGPPVYLSQCCCHNWCC